MTNAARTTVRLRVPALLASLVMFVAVAVLIYFRLRQRQPQIAAAYEARAEHFVKQQDWEAASFCLSRCLEIAPDRPSAIIRSAEVAKQMATTDGGKAMAVRSYYRAVGLAPEGSPLRLDLANLELDLEHYAQAEYQARSVIAQIPDHREALKVVALACYYQFLAGEVQAEEATLQELHRALDANPGDVEISRALATFYREHASDLERAEGEKRADEIMNQMVARQPDEAQTYLTRFRYRQKYNLPDAIPDLETAVAIAAGDPEVQFAWAEHHFNMQNWAEAIRLFADLVKSTKQVEAFARLGECYLAAGEPESAISTWEAGLEQQSDYVPLHLLLAGWFISQNQPDEAAGFLGVLDRLVPGHLSLDQTDDNAEFWFDKELLRAQWHHCEGRSLKAIELLRMLPGRAELRVGSEARKKSSRAWQLLGSIHERLQQWEQAAQSLARAAELEPESVEIKARTAYATAASGNRSKAIQRFEELVAEVPDTPELWLGLATIRLDQQRHLLPPERDLAAIHEALDQAERLGVADERIPLYRADAWLLADSAHARCQALEQLHAAEVPHHGDLPFWQEVVFRYERLQDSEGVQRSLVRLTALSPEPRQLTATSVRLHLQRGDFVAAREAIQTLRESDNREDRLTGDSLLVQLELRTGRLPEAYACLLTQQRDGPQDIGLAWELGKLALKRRDWQNVRHWESQLRQLEGEQGCRWRWLKARSLLEHIENDDDPRFSQVMRLQLQIDAQRPTWPPNNLLKAELEEKQERIDEAILAYTGAINVGVDDPQVYARLIQLLCLQGRVELARLYLAQVREVLPPSVERNQIVEKSKAFITSIDPVSQSRRHDNSKSIDGPATFWFLDRPREGIRFACYDSSSAYCSPDAP